ncbi:MAG: hypothetical protein PHY99_03290 [Bacteroidales bacterium]|nr:hypothetical protein [Bacteroidales bacterium]
MKTLKVLILSTLVCFLALPDLSAQKTISNGVGLAVKASTNGIGIDAVYGFYKNMHVRLGFEKLGFNKDFSFDQDEVTYDATADFKTGSISLLFDYQIARSFFVTAGAGWNLFNVDVDGKAASSLQFGDVMVSPDKIGTFCFVADPSLKVSPYLGIGFGRTLGSLKNLACAFEIGGFYQGSTDLTITADGLLSPTANPDQKQAEKLEGQISQYNIYPVLKFSISYKIVNF